MILAWLVVIPFVAAPVAWWSERWGRSWPRGIACGALGVDLVLALALWRGEAAPLDDGTITSVWLAEFAVPWLPRFGIAVHLAMDGVSLLLVLLTAFLGLAAVVSSWTEIRERVGFFHFNILWVLTGVIGVFLALDLFLFFVLWEVMLVPMYLLISIWGHERRNYAAMKFFLFTQAGSLLMLVAILTLAVLHVEQTGAWSFDYGDLLQLQLGPGMELALMLAFFLAFGVKLPVVPFHAWLPDAHTEAPTGGSVLLAGLLLKTGGYGLLRFTIPLFPHASELFMPVALVLGVAGILYGAVLAFAQTDVKRLVAYSSVSHLGFVLVGIFSWNRLGLSGAVIQMVAHGLSTGALFMLVGALQERFHTREMPRLGGLWPVVPRMAAVTLIIVIASLGLPGLGNFVGEFLVLVGAFQVSMPITIVAATGIIAAALYALVLMQRVFYGPLKERGRIADLSGSQLATVGSMIVLLLWLGLYPGLFVNMIDTALRPVHSPEGPGGVVVDASLGQ